MIHTALNLEQTAIEILRGEPEYSALRCTIIASQAEKIYALEQEAQELRSRAEKAEAELLRLHTARPLSEWHEDLGVALWHHFPICEPPYCGDPLASDWPDYHTHWSPVPDCNRIQEEFDKQVRQ